MFGSTPKFRKELIVDLKGKQLAVKHMLEQAAVVIDPDLRAGMLKRCIELQAETMSLTNDLL